VVWTGMIQLRTGIGEEGACEHGDGLLGSINVGKFLSG
jgi:hypothetical protein